MTNISFSKGNFDVIKYLLALVLTIIVETTVLFIVIRKFLKIKKTEIKNSLLLFTGIFVSFATLPYLWFVLPLLLYKYILLTIIGEGIVFILESIIYYFVLKVNMKQAILLSFICNLFSYILGILLIQN